MIINLAISVLKQQEAKELEMSLLGNKLIYGHFLSSA
jgi:hypothetical protein